MNVLFVSISSLPHISEHSISLDLIHAFRNNGHSVYIVCALERKENAETNLSEEEGCQVLRVKVGNNKKANIIEKGITTLTLPNKYIAAIKEYYSDIKFDLVLYPTPPVTQVETVDFIKKRDGAKSYLLLKDIFPQNAVDIGMMSKTGVKGFIYKHFRKVEKQLYQVSDYIGCMSEANVSYLLKHNPEISPDRVEVCPNSIEIVDKSIQSERREQLRNKYNIPHDKVVFIYGGNLGKPQGIPFIVECLKQVKDNKKAFFLIVGDGTEYGVLETYASQSSQKNFKLMKRLPKEDYDDLVAACDVGLIFLDQRFTIPNFPSRLLSYMQSKIPVLACTDKNTDIGEVITGGHFGWWCESNDENAFAEVVNQAIKDIEEGVIDKEEEFDFLERNYDVDLSYHTIMRRINQEK